ncbi:MAG: hypothetical protein IIA11_08295 [Proteobacteria bacterium]|nr:hypothetical protein [Pseudomonadota bacterium]
MSRRKGYNAEFKREALTHANAGRVHIRAFILLNMQPWRWVLLQLTTIARERRRILDHS